MFKKHQFYNIGPKKYSKSIGFTASGPKSIQKAWVLQHRVQKVVKKHWFYSIGPKKYLKSIGFTKRATKSVNKPLVLQTGPPKTLKKHWFYCKTNPRATGPPGNGPPPTSPRSALQILALDELWGTLTDKLFRELRKSKKTIITRGFSLEVPKNIHPHLWL